MASIKRSYDGSDETVAAGTSAAWLVSMMRDAPLKPKPKARVYEEARKRYSTLGKRGFDRAWSAAILESNAEAWGAPGQRS